MNCRYTLEIDSSSLSSFFGEGIQSYPLRTRDLEIGYRILRMQ